MTKEEKQSIESAKKQSATMLLNEFVKSHVTEVTSAFKDLIPFFDECDIAGLRSCVSTINVTIATVALEVIKAKVESDDAYDALTLPVDATEIQNAIYYITKFVEASTVLSALLERGEHPAIKMAREAFIKESIV